MRTLSAADCITPAINRTKSILFQPFRYGRSWKHAATAYLTSMALFFPAPYFLVAAFIPNPNKSFAFVAAAVVLVLSAIFLIFFSVGARLEFVLFDIVLVREQFVAPSWRRHAPHAWPWIGFRILFSFIVSIVTAPLFILGFRNMFAHMPAAARPGQPPSPELIGSIFLLYALIGIPVCLSMLLSSLVTDFVLPSIALENTTVSEGLRRFATLLRREPGPLSLFILLKVILVIAGMVAMQAVIVIAEIIIAIPAGLCALLGYFLLHSAGEPGRLMMMVGGVLLGAICAAAIFYATMLITGCLHIFLEAYGLYFLGGRYPMVGDILEPQQPESGFAPAAVPPLPPSASLPDPDPAF
jgi:hypothetical protein